MSEEHFNSGDIGNLAEVIRAMLITAAAAFLLAGGCASKRIYDHYFPGPETAQITRPNQAQEASPKEFYSPSSALIPPKKYSKDL